MGNCGGKPPAKSQKISAEQQAKVNEATNIASNNVENDVRAAEAEVKQLLLAEEAAKKKEAEQKKKDEAAAAAKKDKKDKPKEKEEEKEPSESSSQARERRREAESRLKKAKKRLNKLDSLRKARDVGALDADDFNTAVRRLQSSTGNDPTNPNSHHALPEGFEWFTSLLEVMWPSIRSYTIKYVKDQMQPMINRCCQPYGVTCRIKKLDLGRNSPAFGPITARYVAGEGKAVSDKSAVEISLGITIRSDMTLEMSTSAGSVGIQNFSFSGTLYMWLRPFLDTPPFVGAIEMSFVNPPTLELDWTGFVGGSLEAFGFQKMIRDLIDQSIADYCVLPNFYAYPMTADPRVDASKLRCPKPEGALRITVKNVKNAPSNIGKDVRVAVKVGSQKWETPTASNRKLPMWSSADGTHDFLVYNKDQWVIIELLDGSGSDDVVGKVLNVPANRLAKRRTVTVPLQKQSFPVTNDQALPTQVTVEAQWVSIVSDSKAEGDCLVSLNVTEIRGIPPAMVASGPFSLSASSGQDSCKTKPGIAKPGSVPDPYEVLKNLRSQHKRPPAQLASLFGLTEAEADLELVKQAVDKDATGAFTLAKTEEGTDWWMSQHYLLDWQAFRDDKTAKWAQAEQGVADPAITNKEYKRRLAYFESYDRLTTWCYAVTNSLSTTQKGTSPYYCQALHLWAPEPKEVQFSLLDKDGKEVAVGVVPVEDTALGDDVDAEGPFELKFTPASGAAAGASCSLSGDITVRDLMVTDELPTNWNLQADALVAKDEFVDWWKGEEFVLDWLDWKNSVENPDAKDRVVGFNPFNKKGVMWMATNWVKGDKTQAPEDELKQRDAFYSGAAAGGGVDELTDDKELALANCLSAGALTWGDYDVLIAKLKGEPDAGSVAETLEWLNMIVTAMWPGISRYTAGLLKESIEPMIDSTAKGYLSSMSFKFTKINLGRREPAFGTIRHRKLLPETHGSSDKDEGAYTGIELSFDDISFVSQIDIQAAVTLGKTVTVGVKDLLFKGSVLMTLQPMLPDLPLVGAVQIVLPNPPEFDIKLTGALGDMLEGLRGNIPGLDTISQEVITQSIASTCAIPNYYVYPMLGTLDVTALRYPTPIGILRIELKEALHLAAGDTDNSDAYAVLKVGATVHKTKPVTSLNPKWSKEEDNVADFVIYNLDQVLNVELFDADFIGADDTLGAVFHKGAVLGGGIDEIKRGIPVRAVRTMGTAVLPLQEKVKDVVCTGKNTVDVYELRNVVGYDQTDSVVVLNASWMSAEQEGVTNQAFIASVCIHEVLGLNASLGGPYTVKATVCGKPSTTRPGTAGQVQVMAGPQLAATVQRMKRDGIADDKVAKTLSLTTKLVKRAAELRPQSLKKEDQDNLEAWHKECTAVVTLYQQNASPQFHQIMHISFPASRDTELKGDAVLFPVELELLDKKSAVLSRKTLDVSIGTPVTGTFPMDTGPGKLSCTLSLIGFKAKVNDPKEMTADEDVLGLTPFEGPEFVDTPEGVKPKIGMYVCCRNLAKVKELNWKVASKRAGARVARGDRPQPEGKVIGWTQDNARAVVDFGSHLGEWRVKPINLCNAPPPLPPPPPPQKLYVVADEVMEVEGEFDVQGKHCRDQPFWEREAYGEGEVWRLFTDESGRWAIGPAHMEGVAYVRSAQEHFGRFPHMMGHELDVEVMDVPGVKPPRILWQRMDVDLEDVSAVRWVDDATVDVTITKPIAREHVEVLEEMEDQIIDDIMDDLEADLLEDIEADLQEDLQADLQADLENDVAEQLNDIDEEDPAAAAAAEEAEAEAARQAAEEEEARRVEEEESRRQAEEDERRRKEEEEEERKREQAARQKGERDEQQKKAEEEKRQKEAEEKRKKDEAERKKKEEADRKKKEAEDKKKKEEAEKKKKEEEARKKKEEAERKKREEAERKKREEEERRRKEELRKKQAEAERKRREAERKARKAAKRKGKMETLQKALEVGALSKMDHVTALRRLQSVTGEDPTNGDRGYTLPETMQWFSTTMEVLWPHLRQLLSDKMKEVCAPALEAVSSAVGIDKVDLGNHAPAFGPISAKYIDGVDGTPKASVEIGLGLTYQASVDIRFKVGDEETTVQRLKCVGTLYFWLRPFTNTPPFIGGMQAAFVNPPTVKFMFITAQSLALRKAQQVVQKAVEKAMAVNCVVPNFLTIPFGSATPSSFASPAPQGVLRVTVVKAQDLEAADEGFNPTSDPYVVVRVGAEEWRTKTVKESLDPVWDGDNSHCFMVYSPEQWLMLDVYDEDEGKTDDHIGGVVGLPLNRLVLRCLDKDNPSCTIDVPLQRNNQPVQGETGDVSSVTVKAEWLTIDNQSSSEGNSLVAITVKDVLGVPNAFEGPFKIRATALSNGEMEGTRSESRPSFELEAGISPKGLFKQISILLREDKTESYIADTLSIPVDLVLNASGLMGSADATLASINTRDAESSADLHVWCTEAEAVLADRDRNNHPYFLDVIYIHTQSQSDQVKLELLDVGGEVMGSCKLDIHDDKLGDEPDAVGPFEINLSAARVKALVNGHIIVSSLVEKGIPNSWNPKSKRHKAMGDERKKRPNEDVVKANAGGKLTSVKEEALSECLKAGALTWGDYDILIGKLRGESDRTSIAETLEWVNMIINKVWPKLRAYLEGKIVSQLNDDLKQAAASLPGQSWTGLTVDIKRASLGAKEPSFSTINADKKDDGLLLSFNNLQFNSNTDIEMEVTVAGAVSTVRVKDVKFQGSLFVELLNLTDEVPFLGTIESYFANPPHVDLTLEVSGKGEIPGMRQMSVGVVNSAIADLMVLPNSLYTDQRSDGAATRRGVRKPAGVLRLSVLRARHLVAGDVAISYVSSAKSDAYAYVRVGSQIKSTKVVTSLDPEWLETFDFVVQDQAQWVDFELFDNDIKGDDTLGAIFQKETVLGGGTDIISRGMPVLALCRKIWSADDRNKEYVVLPICEKKVDEELSVREDPYRGARVIYKGGGKHKGSVEFPDGSVLDEGDEGVVEQVDTSTTPFHTFRCAFPHCTAELHAGDLKVVRPLIVEKIEQLTGQDGELSTAHVHPEWLTSTFPGKVAAHLITIHLENIVGLPTLAERDFGPPFSVRITAEHQDCPAEQWPVVTSKPGGPEVATDTTLEGYIRSIEKMTATGSTDEEIATLLEITPELVQEGVKLFAAAPPSNSAAAAAEQKLVQLAPAKGRGKKVTFPVLQNEDASEARKRLRDSIGVAQHTMVTVFKQGAGGKKAGAGEKVQLSFDNVAENESFLYKTEVSPGALSWVSRCHQHTDKQRAAHLPTFNQKLYLVSPTADLPNLKLEILYTSLTSGLMGASVLGKPVKISAEASADNADTAAYPLSADIVIEQEEKAGWAWGKTEGYKYTAAVSLRATTEAMKMRS
ncbi:Reticulocyte-binding protein 2-like protein a [Diplonema papillatum]|nr:Reticulocyte-binding protein 2-like protein a [Diplonema papillatum]